MNHFIKVIDLNDSRVSFRPDHVSMVVDEGDDWVTLWFTNGRSIEINKGQISWDLIPVHCSHAGVTRL